jgi:MarR family transcriptional regulator, organic hydroperoxide resistance regulator
MVESIITLNYHPAVATTTAHVTPAREAWGLFWELGMGNRRRLLAALGELGLTFPQAHALRVLHPERPLPMSDLAERLVCDASNVTGIADRLEARGFLERRAGEGDRRVKVLALTPAGAEVRERILDLMTEPPAAIAALPEADQRALRDVLRRAVGQT